MASGMRSGTRVEFRSVLCSQELAESFGPCAWRCSRKSARLPLRRGDAAESLRDFKRYERVTMRLKTKQPRATVIGEVGDEFGCVNAFQLGN